MGRVEGEWWNCVRWVCGVPSERGVWGGEGPRAVLWAGIRCPFGTRRDVCCARGAGRRVPHAERAVMLTAVQSLRRLPPSVALGDNLFHVGQGGVEVNAEANS